VIITSPSSQQQRQQQQQYQRHVHSSGKTYTQTNARVGSARLRSLHKATRPLTLRGSPQKASSSSSPYRKRLNATSRAAMQLDPLRRRRQKQQQHQRQVSNSNTTNKQQRTKNAILKAQMKTEQNTAAAVFSSREVTGVAGKLEAQQKQSVLDAAASKRRLAAAANQVNALLDRALALMRTQRERSALAQLASLLDSSFRQHASLDSEYWALHQRHLKEQEQAMQIKQEHGDLTSKMRALDFGAWSDQLSLQTSIAALEADIRRISNTSMLEQPDYKHNIHPIANLVFRKFMRLEQLLYVLKKKVVDNDQNTSIKYVNQDNLPAPMKVLMTQNSKLQERIRRLEEDNERMQHIVNSAAAAAATNGSSSSSSSLLSPRKRTRQEIEKDALLLGGFTSLTPEVFRFLSRFDTLLVQVF
jgi:hypothetical protein